MGCAHRLITLSTVSTAAPIALTCCAFLLSIRQSLTAGSADAHEAAKSRQLIDTEARSAVAVHTPRGAIELPAHNSRTAVVLFQF